MSAQEEKPKVDMDAGAAEAAANFPPATATVAELAVWWRAYLMKAGHKRLGRVLLDKTKPAKQPTAA